MLQLVPPRSYACLDKVVEQIRVALLPIQLIIEGVPTILSLETLFDFMASGWCIQVHERNEAKGLDKEQVEKQEVYIIKTSKIEHNLKDVKAYVDMVDVNTLKHLSPVNHHVSEITPQVSMILNNVLLVKNHHLFYMKNLQF
jgi:hypothetical protein